MILANVYGIVWYYAGQCLNIATCMMLHYVRMMRCVNRKILRLAKTKIKRHKICTITTNVPVADMGLSTGTTLPFHPLNPL
jgi:hypothetical protein